MHLKKKKSKGGETSFVKKQGKGERYEKDEKEEK